MSKKSKSQKRPGEPGRIAQKDRIKTGRDRAPGLCAPGFPYLLPKCGADTADSANSADSAASANNADSTTRTIDYSSISYCTHHHTQRNIKYLQSLGR